MDTKEAWLKCIEFCGFKELAEKLRASPMARPLDMVNRFKPNARPSPPINDEIDAEMSAYNPAPVTRKSTAESINEMAMKRWGI